MLQQLKEFYEEDPHDPFNVYALALEYLKTDTNKAAALFDELLDKHSNYLPTYYHAAALFAELEQFEKAETIYQKGMELAQNQQNTKTHQELRRAYQMFLDEFL